MRIVLAAVLGGIAMFIWSSFAHVATPLAFMGLQPLPDEVRTIATLHDKLGDKGGLYFFPALRPPVDSKAMADQSARMKSGPSGLLAYQPPATSGLMPRQLGAEFGLEVAEAFLAAVVLSALARFWPRFGVAVIIGVIAAVSTNFSYWNWYGFSRDYTLANAFMELMKYVVGGLIITIVLGWRRRAVRSTAS
jgi:hypothetical protein